MAIGLRQLIELANGLDSRLRGKRLSKALLHSKDLLSFKIGKEGDLIFSLSGQDPYCYIGSPIGEGGGLATPFSVSLRKEVSGGVVEEVKTLGNDRILVFELLCVNEVFKNVKRRFVFELLPSSPNLLLLDEKDKILASLKTRPLSDKRPTLRGVSYILPEPHPLGKNEENVLDFEDFCKKCEEKSSILLTQKRTDRNRPLLTLIKRKSKASIKKIEAIKSDISRAELRKEDGKYGDYIYTHYDEIKPNSDHLEIDGESIALDPKKSLSQNAEEFYKRSKKAKTAIEKGKENLKKAEEEKAQYDQLLSIIPMLDEEGLVKLSKAYGFDRFLSGGSPSQTLLSDPAILPYQIDYEGTRFLFGKNSKQNDFLTFLYHTDKGHYWFHPKLAQGSHLILASSSPSKEELNLAAELVLLASKMEEGEVQYTTHLNLRRGNKPGQVIIKNYQSAFIRKISDKAKRLFLTATKAKGDQQ